jgi:hypothetical protein
MVVSFSFSDKFEHCLAQQSLLVGRTELLHLDCPHLFATPAWVHPNESHQIATPPDLVFVYGLPDFDCFVVFDSSVKLTTMSCEKNIATPPTAPKLPFKI